MQVVVVAGEDGVCLEMDLDVKIARWTTIDAVFAFAGQPDTIALIDSCGNLYRQRLVLLDSSSATAALARVGE
jgi:hypothetical protein